MQAFFRQVVAPLLVVFVFLVALVAVSARIFLPSDMAAPAPVTEMDQTALTSMAPMISPAAVMLL